MQPIVSIIMGSTSDLKVMEKAAAFFTLPRSADDMAYWLKPKYIVPTMSSGFMFSGSNPVAASLKPRSCRPSDMAFAPPRESERSSPPSCDPDEAAVSKGDGPSIESHADITNKDAINEAISKNFFIFLTLV